MSKTEISYRELLSKVSASLKKEAESAGKKLDIKQVGKATSRDGQKLRPVKILSLYKENLNLLLEKRGRRAKRGRRVVTTKTIQRQRNMFITTWLVHKIF